MKTIFNVSNIYLFCKNKCILVNFPIGISISNLNILYFPLLFHNNIVHNYIVYTNIYIYIYTIVHNNILYNTIVSHTYTIYIQYSFT